MKKINVITIDGPSASGKEALSRRVAKHFNLNILDSGVLYRLFAYFFNLNINHQEISDIIKHKIDFKLEEDFMKSSGWANFLANASSSWLEKTEGKKITKFHIINSWIVRQFQNDYNPLHVHGGHISGVGYLKLPNDFGEYRQKNKAKNFNGVLSLVNGSKLFNSPATYNIKPKVGEFYFFPNYLMHVVYPFTNSNEERRSISFNALINDEIYNVYGR